MDWFQGKGEADSIPLPRTEAGGCGQSVQVGSMPASFPLFAFSLTFHLLAPNAGRCYQALVFYLGEHSTACLDASLLELCLIEQGMEVPS